MAHIVDGEFRCIFSIGKLQFNVYLLNLSTKSTTTTFFLTYSNADPDEFMNECSKCHAIDEHLSPTKLFSSELKSQSGRI